MHPYWIKVYISWLYIFFLNLTPIFEIAVCIEKKSILLFCGVYTLVRSTKALLRLIKTTHVAFHHPLLRSLGQKRWVLPRSIWLFSFVTQSPGGALPGPTLGSRALPLGFARVSGATVFLGSLLWDFASTLGFQPCGKQLHPVPHHIDPVCLQLLSRFAQSHPIYTYICMSG